MKTTWILGAGASISCSSNKFPSIDTFFKKAKELNITSETTRKIKKEYQDIQEYVFENFGKNILRKDEKIDIEELLTILEISNGRNSLGKTIVLYEKLISIIQKLFTSLHYNQSNNSEYNNLVNNLNVKDTVLSFNWDLLIDDCFKRIFVLNDEVHKINNQYTQFINNLTSKKEYAWTGSGIKPPYTKYHSEKGYYLKLHGSIDWFYCKNINCRGYNKVFPIIDYKKTHYCGECNNVLSTLIVPPVLNKQYEKYPMISSMWTIAAKELEYTDRLVIWGYSLPPTDFYANWLLRQLNKEIKTVVIINPEIKRGIDQITYNNTFIKKIIGPIKHKVKEFELYEYYQDYITGIQFNEKYKLKQYK